MITYQSTTANELWRTIATDITGLSAGVREQDSRCGATRELLHVGITIENPVQRWVTSRVPVQNIALSLAEVVWIIRGRNDAAFLNYFCNSLPEFSGVGDTYDGAYGYRLRFHKGFDQLDRAYEALKNNPDSRQVVLEIWDGSIDFPDQNGNAVSCDIPCNVLAMLKIRGGKLYWMQINRSNDLFRGIPYNLVQFTALQEILAGWLGIQLGSYNLVCDSLHCYESDGVEMVSDAGIDRINTDSLCDSKAVSDQEFSALEHCIEIIISKDASEQDLLNLLADTNLKTSYRNILIILIAEGLRRRSSKRIHEALCGCSNSIYVHLYERWLSRTNRPQS